MMTMMMTKASVGLQSLWKKSVAVRVLEWYHMEILLINTRKHVRHQTNSKTLYGMALVIFF